MRKFTFITCLILALAFLSCEEVVDIDLDTAPPRLVVDAALTWQKGTAGNGQYIRLTTTAPFFSDDIPVVSGATVNVTNSTNTIFEFIEEPETGAYICNDFVPVLNETYVLTVIYGDQIFTASEVMKPVPAIDDIEQEDEAGFSGEEIELKILFTDDAATSDYYLFSVRPQSEAAPFYQTIDDHFIQGNQSFGLFIVEDLESGDLVDVRFSGISEQYHNYLSILLSIAGGNSGSPFQAPPVTVRGNIVNEANPQNFALGYFSLSEIDVREVVID